jgi:hypothetical protein
MRWTSTHESVEEEEVSALALFETAVAIGLSWFIYRYVGTLRHVAVAAAVAPFLLLRTPESTELGLRFADTWLSRYEETADPTYQKILSSSGIGAVFLFPFTMVYLAGAVFVSVLAKILATLVVLLSYPRHTLSAIPQNWRRVVFCTDLNATPELVPGVEREVRLGQPLGLIQLSRRFAQLRKDNANRLDVISLTLFGLFMPILLVPAIVYRWSLKSTALVWSPLLWIVRPAGDASPLFLTMRRLVCRGVFLAARIYSGVVVLLFVAKLYLFYKWAEARSSAEQLAAWRVAEALVAPQEIPWWQLAAVTNAVLTWVLFMIAQYYLQELEDQAPIPEKGLQTFFTTTLIVRNVLAVYTAACALYILFTTVDPSLFPPLGSKLFPWSM